MKGLGRHTHTVKSTVLITNSRIPVHGEGEAILTSTWVLLATNALREGPEPAASAPRVRMSVPYFLRLEPGQWCCDWIRVSGHASVWGLHAHARRAGHVLRFLPFTFPSVSGNASQDTVTAVVLPLTGQTFKFSGAVVGATKGQESKV